MFLIKEVYDSCNEGANSNKAGKMDNVSDKMEQQSKRRSWSHYYLHIVYAQENRSDKPLKIS